MSDLAVVIPLWRRTVHLARVLDGFGATVPGARVLFVYSTDDAPVVDALRALGVEALACYEPGGTRGDYARKINLGYRATIEPWLFTGADDLAPEPGWWEATEDGRADPRINVIGTNDRCNHRVMAGDHSTHSLVRRTYADHGAVADQPGAIYHEGYWHEYCDDELVQTAILRGCFVHVADAVVEHLHPIHPDLAKRPPDDATYQRGREHTRDSRLLFRMRRRTWQPS